MAAFGARSSGSFTGEVVSSGICGLCPGYRTGGWLTRTCGQGCVDPGENPATILD